MVRANLKQTCLVTLIESKSEFLLDQLFIDSRKKKEKSRVARFLFATTYPNGKKYPK
jgi:hypothetical protein